MKPHIFPFSIAYADTDAGGKFPSCGGVPCAGWRGRGGLAKLSYCLPKLYSSFILKLAKPPRLFAPPLHRRGTCYLE